VNNTDEIYINFIHQNQLQMRLKPIAIFFYIVFLTQNLLGQENSKFQRKAFIFGTSFGVANSNLKFPDRSGNQTDIGLDLKVGYMLNSRLAILLTSNVSIYDYSGFGRDRKRDFGVLAPSLQYWVKDKLWLLSGLGIGGDNPVFWDIENPDTDPLESKYFSGLGFVASVGYELFQSNRNFTIDIKGRLMYRNVNLQEGDTTGTSYGILVGINFY